MINCVSDLPQVGVFSGYFDFPTNIGNKSDRHDIAEILLKVALNTIKQTKTEVNVHRALANVMMSVANKFVLHNMHTHMLVSNEGYTKISKPHLEKKK